MYWKNMLYIHKNIKGQFSRTEIEELIIERITRDYYITYIV